MVNKKDIRDTILRRLPNAFRECAEECRQLAASGSPISSEWLRGRTDTFNDAADMLEDLLSLLERK